MFGADAVPIISFSPPYLASDTRLVKAVFCKSRFLNKIITGESNRAVLNCENCSICTLFRIILRLCIPKRVVFAAPIGEQFGMAALLDNLALVKHGDLIAELAGG